MFRSSINSNTGLIGLLNEGISTIILLSDNINQSFNNIPTVLQSIIDGIGERVSGHIFNSKDVIFTILDILLGDETEFNLTAVSKESLAQPSADFIEIVSEFSRDDGTLIEFVVLFPILLGLVFVKSADFNEGGVFSFFNPSIDFGSDNKGDLVIKSEFSISIGFSVGNFNGGLKGGDVLQFASLGGDFEELSVDVGRFNTSLQQFLKERDQRRNKVKIFTFSSSGRLPAVFSLTLKISI